MENQVTNQGEAITAHREAFYHSLQLHYEGKKQSHVYIKHRAVYDSTVAFLSSTAPKDKNVKKTGNDYYAMDNYVVMKGAAAGEKDYLISKACYENAKDEFGQVDILQLKRLAAWEDVYDIIMEHHIKVKHASDRTTWESVSSCYSNISRKVCKQFVNLCHCKLNQRLPGRPEGIKPILSKTFNDRGQMDLIDMQSNIYNGYTWILHYQDHLTKFSYLRALKNKKVRETV
jgi:hypothetical protein